MTFSKKIWRLVLVLLISQPILCFADLGYSFDTNGGWTRTNAKWMSLVSNSVLLSDMSIPGTHDAGTWTVSDANPIAKTQTMSIERQLQAGVRAFDIRCRYQNNACALRHGGDTVGVDLGQDLADVLTVMKAFLDANPTEAIIMMINNPEGGGATDGSPTGNTAGVTFSAMFKSKYVDNNSAYFYWTSYGAMPSVPTLGQARKKIVLIQNFKDDNLCDGSKQWIGLPGGRWKGSGCFDSRISEQNDYELATNWSLYDKWLKVKAQFELANSSPRGDGKIFTNWLSGSGGSFPYFVASGKSSQQTFDPALLTGALSMNFDGPYPEFPRVGCLGALCSIAFRGTNMMANDYISASGMAARVGIVMADYPDLILIESILSLNTGANGAAIAAMGSSLHEFVRSTSGTLNYRSFNGTTWTAWSDLGGNLISAPTAASWANGRLDVFAVGVDNTLWHIYFDGGAWKGWESLGGVLTSAPTVASWGNGRLDVFARSTDRGLWHRYFNGGAWSGWESMGGRLTSAPTAASWGYGRLEVFVRSGATDHSLWHRYFDGSNWSGWEWMIGADSIVDRFGPALTSAPGASSWGANRLDVFMRDTSNGLLHGFFDGTRWNFDSLGGILNAAAPATASRGSTRVDVIVRGTDDRLYRKSYEPYAWSDWTVP
ncbi:phosphatidylinositol-specific phospholipase C domain-containing protein [Caenimonas koreensis]|uniref:phosphatidylinositol-specific phospholipase C domain-containing protein n=1 Tax=Caenimonas koreensis TaxID=367474 RepID=UPI0037848D6B